MFITKLRPSTGSRRVVMRPFLREMGTLRLSGTDLFAQLDGGGNRSKHHSMKKNMLCRNSQLVKASAERWVTSGTSISRPFPTLRDHVRAVPETASARGWEGRSRVETVSLEAGRIPHSWPHSHCGCLHNSCARSSQSTWGGKESLSPSLPEDLQLMASHGSESVFFRGVAWEKLTSLLGGQPESQEDIDSTDYWKQRNTNKTYSLGVEKLVEMWEELRWI